MSTMGRQLSILPPIEGPSAPAWMRSVAPRHGRRALAPGKGVSAEKVKTEKDGRLPGPKVVKVLKLSKSGNHRPQVKKVTVLGNMRLAAGGTLKRAKKRVTSLKKSSQQP